jgi:hypothetical protein
MYIVIESDFDRDSRRAISDSVSKLLGQSGMAVFATDSYSVAELAASAVETVFKYNGAEDYFIDPQACLAEIIYSGSARHPIPPTYWVVAARARVDEVLKKWKDSNLICAGIIMIAPGDIKYPSPEFFSGEPFIFLSLSTLAVRTYSYKEGVLGYSWTYEFVNRSISDDEYAKEIYNQIKHKMMSGLIA